MGNLGPIHDGRGEQHAADAGGNHHFCPGTVGYGKLPAAPGGHLTAGNFRAPCAFWHGGGSRSRARRQWSAMALRLASKTSRSSSRAGVGKIGSG